MENLGCARNKFRAQFFLKSAQNLEKKRANLKIECFQFKYTRM
jgi:hypothetical protein